MNSKYLIWNWKLINTFGCNIICRYIFINRKRKPWTKPNQPYAPSKVGWLYPIIELVRASGPPRKIFIEILTTIIYLFQMYFSRNNFNKFLIMIWLPKIMRTFSKTMKMLEKIKLIIYSSFDSVRTSIRYRKIKNGFEIKKVWALGKV